MKLTRNLMGQVNGVASTRDRTPTGVCRNCRWCKGLGRQDSGNSVGPCTFCYSERAAEEKLRTEIAQREYERTGNYKDPDFKETFVLYCVETGDARHGMMEIQTAETEYPA